MELIGRILHQTVIDASPILLCVLGGLWAYKANVLNVALEGMMLAGAFTAVLLLYFGFGFVPAYLLAILVSLVLGLIFSLLGITKKGNVIVIGLAINMLVPAVADFVLKSMNSANIQIPNFNTADMKLHIPGIENIPILGSLLSGHTLLTYVSFVLIIVMSILMYRTRFGIYVRVVGENEDSAKSLGLKTNLYKYVAIAIGSVCCALAGINLSVEGLGLFTNNMTAGRGFIAIAAIYCGSGSPAQSAIYALLFGLARSLAINMQIYAGSAATLFDVIPYVIMTVVLAVVSFIKFKNRKERSF